MGAIDDAFRSRLHLTLHYPKLTKRQTKQIWTNNFRRLKTINEQREIRGHLAIKFDEKKILKWIEAKGHNLDWNGRQIRNAFQTAIALAEFDAESSKPNEKGSPRRKAPVMKKSHFREICAVSKEFTNYLREIYGQDEDLRAHRQLDRNVKDWNSKKNKEFDNDSSSGSGSDSSEDSNGKISQDSSSEGRGSGSESDRKSKRAKGKKSETEEFESSGGEMKSKTKKKSEGRSRSSKNDKEKDKKKGK